MQARRALREQAVAEIGDDVEAEGLDRRVSSPKPSSLRRIQRGISAPHASEKRASCEKFWIGMMPGTIGRSMPIASDLVDEVEVGVGVEEVLRDRGVGAGIHLRLEAPRGRACALRACGWYSG